MKRIFSAVFREIRIKFHENTSSGSRVVPYGQTDGQTDKHDEATCHFLQF
jgi:hypothetical protein